jgi:SAM-dependent methyltransferase
MPSLIYDKYQLTNRALLPGVRSVLDVGCRDAILKGHLRDGIIYTGIDLIPGPGVDHVGNAEDGLPFANGAFDTVVALDLLEHTNNIWFVFDELLRVANQQVIILLPNAYHWSFRLQYLRGREMGKYILPAEPILDRHRWLVSYRTARQFCMSRAAKAGWKVSEQVLLGSRRTAAIDLAFLPLWKNLAAWAVVFSIEKA